MTIDPVNARHVRTSSRAYPVGIRILDVRQRADSWDRLTQACLMKPPTRRHRREPTDATTVLKHGPRTCPATQEPEARSRESGTGQGNEGNRASGGKKEREIGVIHTCRAHHAPALSHIGNHHAVSPLGHIPSTPEATSMPATPLPGHVMYVTLSHYAHQGGAMMQDNNVQGRSVRLGPGQEVLCRLFIAYPNVAC